MTLEKNALLTCSSDDCDCLVQTLYHENCTCGQECELSCCGHAMTAVTAKSPELEGKEKHVPVVEKVDGGYKVTVGSVPHPMLDDHYIVFCELQAGADLLRHYFQPGDAPEAVFLTDATDVVAREYCNKHGLWQA